MTSPFPGMDPYLEQFWGDLHHRLITYSSDALQRHLPGDLRARVDERVFVEPVMGQPRNIIPDVRVVERGRREGPALRSSNGIAVAEPLVVHLDQDEPVRQGFIEIIDIKSGRSVVTVIEVLSPSNKLAGPGRDLYLKKQDERRSESISLVDDQLEPDRQPRLDRAFRSNPGRPPDSLCRLRATGMEAAGDRLLRHPPA